jgi:hypothetical protein
MKFKLISAALILLSMLLFENCSSSEENKTKWSVLVANSFIERTPDPDSISMIWDKNNFSWQAGYVMYAMEA